LLKVKLNDLLKGAPPHDLRRGSAAENIESISQDSRDVNTGAFFAAVRGAKADGHDLLAQVCAKNPGAIVVEDLANVPAQFSGAVIKTKDTRSFLDFVARRFNGEPDAKLLCIAVTGTNGKTTTTNIVEHLLNARGRATGVIGTIDHHLKKKVWATGLTTPGSLELYGRLSDFVREGAEALSIEVSSHAITQHRGEFIDFDAAIFTNLTRDHLDYHGTFENYFETKAKLFTELLPRSKKKLKAAAINIDDPYGRELANRTKIPTLTFGQSSADLNFTVVSEDFSGSKVNVEFKGDSFAFELKIPCRYNIYNSLGAVAALAGLGFDVSESLSLLSSFSGVKGRLERVNHSQPFHVLVDYAHTDDALNNVLDSLKTIRSKSGLKAKIITVFGCGGDRDKGKRPLMAKAAVAGSDVVIVTSDNPRTESPDDIIRDILAGVPKDILGKTVLTEVQRRDAIETALKIAGPGDVVLIAGKGHEDYQIIGTQKFPFSDVETVKEILV
jgi:UDP-N-acetylmuramoyl-L-alanyl-D-glutamate--2,6-diaminopimelate ligase